MHRERDEGCQESTREAGYFDVGAVVDRYTVLERLGAGGAGVVYAAFDRKLDRKVALKVLRYRSNEHEARLTREAHAMARLMHRNVVAVFDTGVVDDKVYLAMEFVRGRTLRSWQTAEPRGLSDILRVYAEAGRGLEAAHAAGLVHRDFKPENVLVADDGVIKVTDFGIVRTLDERGGEGRGEMIRQFRSERSHSPFVATSDATTIDSALLKPGRGEAPGGPIGGRLADPRVNSPLTDGALVGTPSYMAPEQFLGETVDERADQFAFCVSLFEAIHGIKPFGGTLDELLAAKLAGRIRESPRASFAPPHIRHLLKRGMSSRPEARYSSMTALLSDLTNDPRIRRRRVIAAVAAAAAIFVAGGASATGWIGQRSTLRAGCATEGAAVYAHWTKEQRESLRASMLADRGPSAAERAELTVTALDRFATTWSQEQESSCLATRLDRTQSEKAYEEREACLVGGRETFDGVVEILEGHDLDAHRRALEVVGHSLIPPRLCSGREAEHAFTPLPDDPARRADGREARKLVARARIATQFGRMKDAAEMAERGAALARKADLPADEAKALLVMAENDLATFDGVEGQRRAEEAVFAALRGGDDDTAGRAAAQAALALCGPQMRPQDARPWRALAWAHLARLGRSDGLEQSLWGMNAGCERAENNPSQAANSFARQIALLRSLYGEHSTSLCDAINDYGSALQSSGDYQGSLTQFREASLCYGRETGDHNPRAAVSYGNEGEMLLALGRFAEATAASRHAAQLRVELGSADPIGLYALSELALEEVGLGRFDEALADAESVVNALDQRDAKDAPPEDSASRSAHMMALLAIGEVYAAKGAVSESRAACERAARDLGEELLPTDFEPLRCLGEAELAAGHIVEARKVLERNAAIHPILPGELARTDFALARALMSPPRPDPERARQLAASARESLRREVLVNPSLASPLAEVERWMGDSLTPEGDLRAEIPRGSAP